MSPAGMEPRERRDIDEAAKGRAFGRNASQSNLRVAPPLSWPTFWRVVQCPRREWSPRERRDIDEAPQGRAFGRNASQSNLRVAPPLSWPTFWRVVQCPRRESNPHLSSP